MKTTMIISRNSVKALGDSVRKQKMRLNSPFRYAGGKFYARDLILEHVPKSVTYCEPLAGGASIFFAKPKSQHNWLNDIDEELINCFLHIRDNPDELLDFLEGIPASKERHSYFKSEFKPSNDLERAARWFYLNRTSYSGIMNTKNCYWGYGDKYSMRPENWRRHVLRCSKKLQGVRITCYGFEYVIDEVADDAFLFVDPPYFNRDQDKFYNFTFCREDHERLARTLKRHRNRIRFLLTYDNCAEIRNMYSWAVDILDKEWNYTINRTDDQTGKTKAKGKRYKGKEIFILNYKSFVQKKLIQR